MKYSVIVAYNPTVDILIDIIRVLNRISVNVIIVDNNSYNKNCYSSLHLEGLNFDLVLNERNLGIAKAQNIGIKKALSEGADVICFFDQDSVVPKRYKFLLEKTISENIIFCPLAINSLTNEPFPSFLITKIGLPKSIYPSEDKTNRLIVDLAISSGLSVPANVFHEVGLMKSELFIDYVDFEWMFRTKSYGITAICLTDIHMYHSVGLGNRKYKGMGIIHNPFRNYYKQRNPFYLLSYRHVPKLYSIKMILSSIFQSLVNIVCESGQRKEYFYSFLKGVVDGVKFLFSVRSTK
ncbi:glycosyltransferase [Shewanella morhuae]|uniref:glycosyltransferase n=1 Tax=Shewanella morhuae TaxID=365591 RepID=UPI001BBD6E5C|nr:glycosyltransferase [Shewanella morhuae]GIU15116.1 dTDP-rhamnosyl transferase RfbF [Shewanella morhuae]